MSEPTKFIIIFIVGVHVIQLALLALIVGRVSGIMEILTRHKQQRD